MARKKTVKMSKDEFTKYEEYLKEKEKIKVELPEPPKPKEVEEVKVVEPEEEIFEEDDDDTISPDDADTDTEFLEELNNLVGKHIEGGTIPTQVVCDLLYMIKEVQNSIYGMEK